jgi:hypothetical protein
MVLVPGHLILLNQYCIGSVVSAELIHCCHCIDNVAAMALAFIVFLTLLLVL